MYSQTKLASSFLSELDNNNSGKVVIVQVVVVVGTTHMLKYHSDISVFKNKDKN